MSEAAIPHAIPKTRTNRQALLLKQSLVLIVNTGDPTNAPFAYCSSIQRAASARVHSVDPSSTHARAPGVPQRSAPVPSGLRPQVRIGWRRLAARVQHRAFADHHSAAPAVRKEHVPLLIGPHAQAPALCRNNVLTMALPVASAG